MSLSYTRQATVCVNAAADGVGLALAGGGLEYMTGSEPTLPDDTSSETVLARVDFGSFSPAIDGILEYEFTGVAVQAAGTVGWWRCVNSLGATFVDGPVYAIGDAPIVGGLALASLTFADGQVLTGTFRYKFPKTDS